MTAKVELLTPSGGKVILDPTDTAVDRTLTLPAVAGTVLNTASDIEAQVKTATSATGSAPIFSCRAWVNFNGTGTVAIRASGNVSSITDNGTGDYTVNFANAMVDANYAVNANNSPNFAGAFSIGAALFSNGTPTETAPTTSAARVFFGNTAGSAYDPKYVCVSFFR